jgi:hypothetical protein
LSPILSVWDEREDVLTEQGATVDRQILSLLCSVEAGGAPKKRRIEFLLLPNSFPLI